MWSLLCNGSLLLWSVMSLNSQKLCECSKPIKSGFVLDSVFGRSMGFPLCVCYSSQYEPSQTPNIQCQAQTCDRCARCTKEYSDRLGHFWYCLGSERHVNRPCFDNHDLSAINFNSVILLLLCSSIFRRRSRTKNVSK